MALARAPRVEEEEVEQFNAEEIQLVIKTALTRRNWVRFVVALALGCRQGEALGFKWERLDRANKTLRVKKALQRQTWQHGCDNPHACGAKYHKTQPCKHGCLRHTRKPCPPPCRPNCTDHARWCPNRHSGGLVEVDVKSRAGRRSFAVPDELYALLLKHEQLQQREREHAGSEWQERGWIFTQPTDRPIDPRRDRDEWRSVLAEAGVRDARLHYARHTAATVLLVLNVGTRAVMDMMGWSSSSMAAHYQHVTNDLRHDIADSLGGLFWGATGTEQEH